MTDNTKIHPFRIDIPQHEIDDLHRRLDDTRWPAPAPGGDTDWSRGVPVGYLRELVGYWRDSFDWRAAEARLNGIPQFRTEIDGQNVHFLHVRSPEPNAMPLLLTHGWPGSIVEFLDLIGPLTDPCAHGGEASDAFDVVVPALPGFGFSGATSDTGWTTRRIAYAWSELMNRLGYQRYVAQGGDFGSGISRDLGIIDPEHVIAIHVNGGLGIPMLDEDEIGELGELDRKRIERMGAFMAEAGGYIAIQSTRPQTLAYGLVDSPVGLLGWIVDKIRDMTDLAHELPDQAVDRDLLLTNVSIWWFTATAGSAGALYYEDAHAEGGWGPPETSTVPAGVAAFTEQDIAIRSWDERHNNVVHWSEFDRGGHFAAMEAPDLLLDDVRSFFRRFR